MFDEPCERLSDFAFADFGVLVLDELFGFSFIDANVLMLDECCDRLFGLAFSGAVPMIFDHPWDKLFDCGFADADVLVVDKLCDRSSGFTFAGVAVPVLERTNRLSGSSFVCAGVLVFDEIGNSFLGSFCYRTNGISNERAVSGQICQPAYKTLIQEPSTGPSALWKATHQS